MKKSNSITVLALAAAALISMVPHTASAQCSTCVTQPVAYSQVAYSPVAYNSYAYDGWYLGKYLGRASRRVFGVAPAAAYQVGYPRTYAAAYPRTYGVGYAPAYTYPSRRVTYRPVIMQAAPSCSTCCNTCNTCDTCSTCGTVGQAIYQPSASSSCPSCVASSYSAPAARADRQPRLPANNSAPPSTFLEPQRTEMSTELAPIPADETSLDEQNASFLEAPLLLDPHDKLTKRPTAPVWNAVYKKQAGNSPSKTRIKAVSRSVPRQSTGWTSGR